MVSAYPASVRPPSALTNIPDIIKALLSSDENKRAITRAHNISLRWHYPDQVMGRSYQLPLSLSYKLPLSSILCSFYVGYYVKRIGQKCQDSLCLLRFPTTITTAARACCQNRGHRDRDPDPNRSVISVCAALTGSFTAAPACCAPFPVWLPSVCVLPSCCPLPGRSVSLPG